VEVVIVVVVRSGSSGIDNTGGSSSNIGRIQVYYLNYSITVF